MNRLPPELLTEIFCLVATQKVERKSILKYKNGYQLVPFLQSSSQVSHGWRNFILENAPRRMRALMLEFDIRSGIEWNQYMDHVRYVTQKYRYCPILVYLDLCDDDIEPSVLGTHLRCLLDTNNVPDRLQAIEIVCRDTLLQQLSDAVTHRTISNLEHVSLAIYRYSFGIEFQDITLESETVLPGSMFPRFVNLEPSNPYFSSRPWVQLVFSDLRDLTCIRILTDSEKPTWADLTGILTQNPELQNLSIQLAHKSVPASSPVPAFRLQQVTGISLLRLTKCYLKAEAYDIWHFLSIQEIIGLKYLSLTFIALPFYEPIPVPVLSTDLSRLTYLSIQPLCSVTANFIAKAGLRSLVSLNLAPKDLDIEGQFRYHGADAWPHSISLPALTAFSLAGARVRYATLFLQSLAEGAKSMPDTPHPLRSITLDLTQWRDEEFRPWCMKSESELLQDTFSESIFHNVTTLSIEQGFRLVTVGFLATILSFMPSVTRLYLSRTWKECVETPAEHFYSSCASVSVMPGPMPSAQLTLLEFNNRSHNHVLYLPSKDEAELVQLLEDRVDHDHDHEAAIHLKQLRLRVYPGLRPEIRTKLERMNCSVEDQVDFSYRLSAAQEFEEL